MIRSLVAAAAALALCMGCPAQTAPSHEPIPAPQGQGTPGQGTPGPQKKDQQTHITSAQAKELFASVDQILQFASNDTRLPIEHTVKRRLTTRAAVEKYLVEKMNDDKDARRMQRSEIVLKKFGLLDRDFDLQPFLVTLLKEQIAGYYDAKTKTVNLLDWIEPDSQKPVLAHELTHALQDQKVNLEKWEDPSEDDLSRNFQQDNHHIAVDEEDTAREAVLEGQAMAVYIDYGLSPAGKSILTNPDLIESRIDQLGDDSDSPVMARAPLLLQESLLFPYKDGLRFEIELLKARGQQGAYAGVLERPPATSYEVMNPRQYERQVKPPLLAMPDVHPLLDHDYNPYDIGVMGELDVKILAELFGGEQMAKALTPAWDGGIYYAVQRKNAPDKATTASIALFYLSRWKSPTAAEAFARMYAGELGKKYSNVTRDTAAQTDASEQVYQTSEGPALLVTSGNSVFVSESFDLATARKLAVMLFNAQAGAVGQVNASIDPVLPQFDPAGSLVHFMAGCGVMKAALPH